MSPTQRTLALLRKYDLTAQVVERWNPHARIRQDLFGCIDIVAVGDGMRVTGIQACAGASVAARLKKAMAEPRLKLWLNSGGTFEVWGWRKVGKAGKRKTWAVRKVSVCLVDGEFVPYEH